MLLSKASLFSKAYRCHVTSQVDEGKKPMLPGGVIHVRKCVPNVAGWSCSLEAPPHDEPL